MRSKFTWVRLRPLVWSLPLALLAAVAVGVPLDGRADEEAGPALVPEVEAPSVEAAPTDGGNGLRGVFPAEPPTGLLLEDFEALPPAWQAWGQATADAVAKLYEDESLDVAGQRAQLQALRARIGTMNDCIGDPRYGMMQDVLLGLRGRLARRVVLAEAVLDTLEADPATRDNLASLIGAIEDFEEDNASAASAAIRELAPQVGPQLRAVLLEHYLNYNLRIVAGEELFRSFVAECRVQDRPVIDCFMATSIRGHSTTNTSIDIDLLPSAHGAEFEITANGDVSTRTTGYNKRATLFTRGNHHFVARKRFRFDGERITAMHAQIDVNANNHTYAAKTKVSKLPLIGKIADDIALKKAREARGKSNAHAAMRLREQVTPEFDQETDNTLAETNHDLWHEVNPRLRKLGLYPEAYAYRTGDTSFHADYRVVGAGEIGGGSPIEVPVPANGIVARVHEGYVNTLVDRIGIAGQTMTEQELRQRIAEFTSELTGEPVAVEPAEEEEDPSQFIFAEQDPIRVKFEDGQLLVTIRTGLKREGEEDIPVQEITVPLAYELDGDVVRVTRGSVKVSLRGGLGVAAVLRSRIEKAIEENRTRDAWVDFDTDNGPMRLHTTNLSLVDGWLMIEMQK